MILMIPMSVTTTLLWRRGHVGSSLSNTPNQGLDSRVCRRIEKWAAQKYQKGLDGKTRAGAERLFFSQTPEPLLGRALATAGSTALGQAGSKVRATLRAQVV